MNSGGQADLFHAHRLASATPTVTDSPPSRLSDSLVVKLFRGGTDQQQAVAEQYHAMLDLRSAMHAIVSRDWTINIPLAIYCDDATQAIVLEHASGRTVRQWMQGTPPAATVWQPVADAILVGLTQYWRTHERIFGDLNLRNILCDQQRKTISFIDAGAPGTRWHFREPPCEWFPASRDLAYLLYFVATEIKVTLFQPSLWQQQLCFVEYLLERYLEQEVAPSRQALFAEELHHCAAVHLAGLRPDGSPAGIWRRYVQRTATKTIRRAIAQLTTSGAAKPLRNRMYSEVPAR